MANALYWITTVISGLLGLATAYGFEKQTSALEGFFTAVFNGTLCLGMWCLGYYLRYVFAGLTSYQAGIFVWSIATTAMAAKIIHLANLA
jgi:hypothetical protein